VVLLLAVLGSGCAGRRSSTKQQFALEATRPPSPAQTSRDAVLAVREFTIDPLYTSRGLVYRKSESRYESDAYNEFVIAPQALLTSQTRHWLSRSALFKTVLEPGSLVGPTHILESTVLALYGDFRDRNQPQAVMQVRVFLVASKGSQPEIVFTRDYQAAQEAQAPTAGALVAAFDRCLEQILSALEADLEKVL
jgi:ABC-type uncharacterized transport system auxiliary subunit